MFVLLVYVVCRWLFVFLVVFVLEALFAVVWLVSVVGCLFYSRFLCWRPFLQLSCWFVCCCCFFVFFVGVCVFVLLVYVVCRWLFVFLVVCVLETFFAVVWLVSVVGCLFCSWFLCWRPFLRLSGWFLLLVVCFVRGFCVGDLFCGCLVGFCCWLFVLFGVFVLETFSRLSCCFVSLVVCFILCVFVLVVHVVCVFFALVLLTVDLFYVVFLSVSYLFCTFGLLCDCFVLFVSVHVSLFLLLCVVPQPLKATWSLPR